MSASGYAKLFTRILPAGHGGAALTSFLDHLGFELWAVEASFGARCAGLVWDGVHDLHRGHYRFEGSQVQYGFAGRLRRDDESRLRPPSR